MLDFVVKYWVQFFLGLLSGGLLGGFRYMWKKLREALKRTDQMEALILQLGKERIIEIYNKWIDLGYCPISARESLSELYSDYAARGGNGTGRDLYERLLSLPTEPPEG